MKLIPNAVTQKVGNELLSLKKASPKLMFVAGIAGVIGSTVLACRATLKLPEKLDTFKQQVDDVKELGETTHIPDVYTKRENHKDLAYVYIRNSYEIVKLYGPAIIVGGTAIAALTGSHITLTRRNASLTAAYSALQLGFENYRERVKKELGEERESDIYRGLETKEITVDGKLQTIKVCDPNKLSPYARFFDEASPNWQKNPELNRLFVQCQQNYANHLLHARGHVFLNEVYDMLGLDRSSAGQVVGWIIGEDGDNFIDFGMFEPANAAFINGWERSILLDFNVDGVIYDKL